MLIFQGEIRFEDYNVGGLFLLTELELQGKKGEVQEHQKVYDSISEDN